MGKNFNINIMKMTNIFTNKIESIRTGGYDICVVKGVSKSVIRDLRECYSFVDNFAIEADGSINLKKIDMKLAMEIFSMAPGEMKLMTYESFSYLFQTINNLGDFKKQFIVLNNNAVSYYENPSSTELPDREKYENEENENALINKFYPDWINRNGKAYVAYYNAFEQTFPFVDLIEPISFETLKLNRGDGASFSFCGMDNVEMFIQQLMDDQLHDSDFIIEAVDKDEPKMKVLNALAELKGVNIRFWATEADSRSYYREELLDILREVWRYKNFRDIEMYNDPDLNRETRAVSQGEIIEHIVGQCEAAYEGREYRDTILTASTGAGKSLLFQLSAIYLARKYKKMTIVVSPLVSLMEDQLVNLRSGYNGVAALNSSRTPQEWQAIMDGIQRNEIDILYLSPELLLSYTLNTFVGKRQIGLFVVDEAHTVTTWGRDFRVDYWFLGDYIHSQKKNLGYKFPIVAMTATAMRDITRVNDMVFETIDSLCMNNCKQYIGVVRRDNISFDINQADFKGPNYMVQRTRKTAEVIKEAIDKGIKAVVYFPYKNDINTFIDNAGLQEVESKIGKYHAELEPEEKKSCMKKFGKGEIQVVLATKAFGMGVDIKDIQMVYHHAPSGSISDYVQEIGRAGRQINIQGVAKLDFDKRDLSFGTKLFGLSAIKSYQLKGVLRKLMELYRLNGEKRNMLINPDDFSYLFTGNNVDYDQKLKSCLMLLSKDLQNKLNFRSFVVRPKNIFTKCFVSVPSEDVNLFKMEFGMYAKQIGNASNIFYLDCENLWNDRFSMMTFPQFKLKLASRNLHIRALENVTILYKLTLSLNKDVDKSSEELCEFFNRSERILAAAAMDNRRLTIGEIKENYLQGYDKQDEFIETFRLVYGNGQDAYCRFRDMEDSNETQIQCNRCGYEAVKAMYMRIFRKEINEESIVKYTLKEDRILTLAQILNSLSLAVYDRIGGDKPSVFVRINNPYYMNSLTKRRYNNNILNGIYKKFEQSKELFTFFFTSQMDNKRRWDFIEDYFLGFSAEELIEKYEN